MIVGQDRAVCADVLGEIGWTGAELGQDVLGVVEAHFGQAGAGGRVGQALLQDRRG